MPQQPTSGGGQNQTLLELIYSMKGLAQTIELFHQDLSRKLDEESKTRSRELARLNDLLSKNSQAIGILPITFSDRAEKLINKMSVDMAERLSDVEDAVTEVRRGLEGYSRTAERAISQNENSIAQETDERADITGRIEVNEKGDVKVQINSAILKKIWYGVIIIATGGGAYGFVELLKRIF